MKMSLKYAILGLLSVKPQTGYEIKANFNQSIRYIWNSDQSQIYRTLAEIADEGLATSKTVQQEGKPNKKIYELTEEGSDELREWLASPLQPKGQRNEELLQVFFSGLLSDEEILQKLKRVREGVMRAMSGLSSMEAESELFNPENKTPKMRFFFEITLELGRRSMQLNLDWIDGVIKRFENGEFPSGSKLE
jgi:PadR family transcriptional regulator AphA